MRKYRFFIKVMLTWKSYVLMVFLDVNEIVLNLERKLGLRTLGHSRGNRQFFFFSRYVKEVKERHPILKEKMGVTGLLWSPWTPKHLPFFEHFIIFFSRNRRFLFRSNLKFRKTGCKENL